MSVQETTLYFKNGSSDKVYQTQINDIENNEYTVTYAYGRRGSALKTGTKTNQPVELEKAEKVYKSLINSKIKKGYKPSEDTSDDVAYTADENSKKISGIFPQLLNIIDKNQAERLLQNRDFILQEKHDGERRLVLKNDKSVKGINRRGLYVDLKTEISEALNKIPASFLIDCEDMGSHLVVFDVLEYGQIDLKESTLEQRLTYLHQFDLGNLIKISPFYSQASEKTEQFNKIKKSNKEGVVFKNRYSVYSEGRPNSGGNQLKYKFYSTCSVVVSGINSKRSVSVCANDTDIMVELGNVTIPPNKDIPSINEIIEVRYLYAYKGGSLYQPCYLGKRNDILLNECSVNQLKYKVA